jgi:hypothetical protein
MVVLQNCMDILHSEPGPCSDIFQMSCDNGNQVVGIKVEEVTDLKEEEDLWATTSTGIETEAAVSCVCIACCSHCTDIQNFLSIDVFSVCVILWNVD